MRFSGICGTHIFHYSELSTLCHPAVVELKPSNDMMETIQLMPDHTGLVAQHQTINSGIYALVDPDIVNKKREMREQVQQGVHFRLRFLSWETRLFVYSFILGFSLLKYCWKNF